MESFKEVFNQDFLSITEKNNGQPVCEKCNDTGRIEKKDQVIWCQHCEVGQRGIERERNRHIRAANIPKRFSKKTWDDYKTNNRHKTKVKAKKRSRKYCNKHEKIMERGISIVFKGPVGVGKTLLSCLILKEYSNLGYKVHYTKVTRLLEKLRPGGDENQSQHYNKLVSVDLLNINDFDRANRTDWVKEKILDIFDDRYDKELPTIITTNTRIENMVEDTENGPSLKPAVDRLKEQSAFITITGESERS